MGSCPDLSRSVASEAQGPLRARPMKAQGGPQGPGPQGRMGAHKGSAHKGPGGLAGAFFLVYVQRIKKTVTMHLKHESDWLGSYHDFIQRVAGFTGQRNGTVPDSMYADLCLV